MKIYLSKSTSIYKNLALEEALLKLDAQFKGRNDLLVNGYKISGNAQYIYKDRIVHHGTLLFDSNLTVLSKALKPNLLKLKSKAIKSARQRVSNINNLLDNKLTSTEFINLLINHFIDKENKNLIITDEIKQETKILEKRNQSWDWIYGKSPKFMHKIEYYFQGGLVEILTNIEKGIIKNILIYGDFLSKKDISIILKDLEGVPYTKSSIAQVLNKYDLSDYFGSISGSEIIDLILKKEK